MPLPSSGIISGSQIAASVGLVNPSSLREATLATGVSGPTTPYEYSSFYNWGDGGYKYGSPGILHDFALNANYSNAGSTISDRSGNSRNGTWVSGTGNGSSSTITGYSSSFAGNINIPGDSPQLAIRLDDFAKFSGTSAYTAVAWIKVPSFTSSYPGIIASEGRIGGSPIGWGLILTNDTAGYRLFHQRFNGSSGSGDAIIYGFTANGQTFSLNTWYMVAARYNGSVMHVHWYNDSGTLCSNTTGTSTSLSTDGSWGAFAGLRYNHWLNGQLGYVAIYGSDIDTTGLNDIYAKTKARYGY